MLLAELVETSRAVGATSARREKVAHLAAALRRLDPSEVPAGVAFLSGELRQRQIGVGWASLRDAPAGGERASDLTVADVDAAFERIGACAGPGPSPSAAACSATSWPARARRSSGSSSGCWPATCARARSRA